MLPRFLLADNSQELPDTIFIVHTQKPLCIIESDIDDFNSNQTIHWMQTAPTDKVEIEELLDDAEVFYNEELDSQEDLYDEEFE